MSSENPAQEAIISESPSSVKPFLIALLVTVAVLLVGVVAWIARGNADDSAQRDQLTEFGVLTTMQTDGKSIGSVNFSTIKDKANFAKALEVVLQLRNLTSLNMNGMPISNTDLEKVGQLTSLASLSLCDTKIGGAGLSPLGRLHNLETLFLSKTQVTDSDLKGLTQLDQLSSVDLSGSQLRDDLSSLAELPNLKWVLLNDLSLGEHALAGLRQAPSLTRVTLGDAEYSAIDLQDLMSAAPELTVDKND